MTDSGKRPVELTGTRVVVVCGHFSPEVGYQEVDLAKAFARLGARVRVVTSTCLSPNARTVVADDYEPGTTHRDGYELVRLPPRLTIGPNILGCDVLPAVAAFTPTHVVLVGPGKLFGLELFSPPSAPWQRIAIVQDNSEDGRSRVQGRVQRRARALATRLVKRPAYRKVVENADRIVLNVPETRGIVDSWLTPTGREALAAKSLELRLGFDPDVFGFDGIVRDEWRRLHGIGRDELVLVTCTRATPAKRLEDVFEVVSSLRARGLSLRYALAGVLNDSYGEHLRRRAAGQPDPDAFLLFPALPHDQMSELFSGCDLGYWPQAAITIQQAMGTGLPMLLPLTPTVSHLLTEGRNGWYVTPSRTLDQMLVDTLAELHTLEPRDRLGAREASAAFNRSYLSYDRLAFEMIDDLRPRATNGDPLAAPA